MSLSLSTVERFVPLAARKGVSEVARSPRGFLQAFRRAGGKLSAMSPEWQAKREAFIKRHMAQVSMRKEALFDKNGDPSRRHLALIMWAYSPQPSKLKAPRDNPVRIGKHPDLFDDAGYDTPITYEYGDWRKQSINDLDDAFWDARRNKTIQGGPDSSKQRSAPGLDYDDLFEVLETFQLVDSIDHGRSQDEVLEMLAEQGVNEQLADALVRDTQAAQRLRDSAMVLLDDVMKAFKRAVVGFFDENHDETVNPDDYIDEAANAARKVAREIAQEYPSADWEAAWDEYVEDGDLPYHMVKNGGDYTFWNTEAVEDVEVEWSSVEDLVDGELPAFDLTLLDKLDWNAIDPEVSADDVWEYLTEKYLDRDSTQGMSVDGPFEYSEKDRPALTGTLYIKIKRTVDIGAVFHEQDWRNFVAARQDLSEEIDDDEDAGKDNVNYPSESDGAFWAWFGNSVVREDDGRPKVCFHGSKSAGFHVFSKEKIDAHHAGFFFASKMLMSRTYTPSDEEPMGRSSVLNDTVTRKTSAKPFPGIYRVFLRIENPLVVDAEGRQWNRIKYEPMRTAVSVLDLAQELLRVYRAAFTPGRPNRRAEGGSSDWTERSSPLKKYANPDGTGSIYPGAARSMLATFQNAVGRTQVASADHIAAVHFGLVGLPPASRYDKVQSIDFAAALEYVETLVAHLTKHFRPQQDSLLRKVEYNTPNAQKTTTVVALAEALWDLLPSLYALRDMVYSWTTGNAVAPDVGSPAVSKLWKEAELDMRTAFSSVSKAFKIKAMSILDSNKGPVFAESEMYTKTDLLAHYAKDNGYDGLIVKNVHDSGGELDEDPEGTVYVVFDPNQVKSVHNKGTWSREDDDIRKNPVMSTPVRRR